MRGCAVRFDERLRRLEALEAAQTGTDGPAAVGLTEADWDALHDPLLSDDRRETILARYGVVGDLPAKVYVGVCVCWGDGTCPVCEGGEEL
jgi:hypothetical protein